VERSDRKERPKSKAALKLPAQKTDDANLRMLAMLFQHKNMVNTAFAVFPVMRLDRIFNFAPESSVAHGRDRETTQPSCG
jgi:hypothetical protein